MSLAPPLLEVRDLKTYFDSEQGEVRAVDGVSFHIGRGETLAVVGESGSGKSVTSLSIMRLIAGSGRIAGGSILLNGVNLLDKQESEMRRIRGNDISMIFQEPMTSLNPVFTVGSQIAETIALHRHLGAKDARRKAIEMLDLVGIPEPGRRFDVFPHQMSGGMRQRVMIAMALSCSPKLLIADEPTTALDVTIQAQILDLMRRLQKELGMSILFITHDLGVVAEVADRVVVMYAGRAVEVAPVDELFANPRMPYTIGLLGSVPRVDLAAHRQQRLRAIPGSVPNPADLPPGCAFQPRCRFAVAACARAVPPLEDSGGGHMVRCLRSSEIPAIADGSVDTKVVQPPAAGIDAPASAEPLLEVRGLSVSFPIRGGFASRVVARVQAVTDISFDIGVGEVVGLVGESGSGKTTAGQALLRLIEPTGGKVMFDGIDVGGADREGLRFLRRRMQIIFQDPFASLNPRMTVQEIVGEAFVIHKLESGADRRARIAEILRSVGLSPDHMRRYPHEFSGGQRQRIGIARALAVKPQFIVADEPVSALDVSIQAQVVNLLQDLKQQLGLTLLFIAHDLGVVEYLCDRVIVMYLGRIMEVAPARRLYASPTHPYTEALLSGVPIPDPTVKRQRIILEGDIPSPIDPPSGCVFRTRCRLATAECGAVVPPLKERAPGHFSACIKRP
ncbi:MAG: ABC transporter ATP-binding protein [Alphaproteobacteria bacterium]|nr:ABC transporter ATP-binding protein [Alphaproteobacteria bacterium]